MSADGSGAGRALAAGPGQQPGGDGTERPRWPPRPVPSASVRSAPDALNPRKRRVLDAMWTACGHPPLLGHSNSAWKLDLFARLANSYDRDRTNFVLSVDKRGRRRYRLTGSSRHAPQDPYQRWGVRHGQTQTVQPAGAAGRRGRRDIVVASPGRPRRGPTAATRRTRPARHGSGRRRGPAHQAVRREAGRRADGLRLREGQGVDPRPADRAQRGRHPAHRVREHHGRDRRACTSTAWTTRSPATARS